MAGARIDVDMNRGRRKNGFSMEDGCKVVVVGLMLSRRRGRRRAIAREEMPAAMP